MNNKDKGNSDIFSIIMIVIFILVMAIGPIIKQANDKCYKAYYFYINGKEYKSQDSLFTHYITGNITFKFKHDNVWYYPNTYHTKRLNKITNLICDLNDMDKKYIK